mmetsp:Transcript_319/g.350  ORF Transcript_319/g.350 Transcript_319/m.350 type:complete len:98 (+) Transcript_319:633-926(+)
MVEICQGKDFNLVFTNKAEYLPFYYYNKDMAMHFQFDEGKEPILKGDVHFNFKHQGMANNTSFCRVSFNTAFIQQNGLVVTKQTVSPDSIKKNNNFG